MRCEKEVTNQQIPFCSSSFRTIVVYSYLFPYDVHLDKDKICFTLRVKLSIIQSFPQFIRGTMNFESMKREYYFPPCGVLFTGIRWYFGKDETDMK